MRMQVNRRDDVATRRVRDAGRKVLRPSCLQVVHHAAHAILEQCAVEVDDETKAVAGQFQISEHLSHVDRVDLFDGLYLDDHGTLHPKIQR